MDNLRSLFTIAICIFSSSAGALNCPEDLFFYADYVTKTRTVTLPKPDGFAGTAVGADASNEMTLPDGVNVIKYTQGTPGQPGYATCSFNVEVEWITYCPPSAAFFAMMGAMFSLVFSNMGAAFGTWKSSVGMCAMAMMKMTGPEQVMRAMLPVIMAGVSGIYGLIISVIIGNNVRETMSTFNGYAMLCGGLVCGLSNLAAGMAQGIAGEPGIKASARQPKLYVGMVLVWSFANALGLYGLIVGLIMCSLDGDHLCPA